MVYLQRGYYLSRCNAKNTHSKKSNHDREINYKVYSSLPLPFAKFDLLSLFQRDKMPPDKGVIEGVHICGDERTPPIHLGNINIV